MTATVGAHAVATAEGAVRTVARLTSSNDACFHRLWSAAPAHSWSGRSPIGDAVPGEAGT